MTCGREFLYKKWIVCMDTTRLATIAPSADYWKPIKWQSQVEKERYSAYFDRVSVFIRVA